MKNLLLLFTLLITCTLSNAQVEGLNVSNFATNDTLDLALIDGSVSRININQTTGGITLTVPVPTYGTTKVIEKWIGNKGTVPFTLIPGAIIDTGTFVILKWVGGKYSVCGKKPISSVTSIEAIAPLSYVNDTIRIDTTKVPYFSGGISGVKNSSTYLNGSGVWDTITPIDTTALMRKSGGIFTGPINGVTPTQLTYLNSLTSNVQTQIDSISNNTKSQVGIIYTENFDANTLTNNYTVRSSTTASVTAGSSINLSGGNGTRTRGIILKNYISASDRWEINTLVKLNSVNNAGFLVSINDPDDLAFNFDIKIDPSTASATKLLVAFNGVNFNNGIVGALRTVSFGANDTVSLNIKLSQNVLTINLSNLSSTVAQSISYSYRLPSGYRILGNPYIATLGGSQSIIKFDYIDNNINDAGYIYLGDSNAHGFGCEDLYYRVTNVLKRRYGIDIINFAGNGKDQTSFDKTEVFNILKKYNAHTIILEVGVNDPTDHTAYASLVTSLDSMGYNLILMNLSDRVGMTSDVVAFNAFQKLTYKNTYKIVDIYSLLGSYTSSLYNVDGIHYDYIANSMIAGAVSGAIQSKEVYELSNELTVGAQINSSFGIGGGLSLSAVISASDSTFLSSTNLNGLMPASGYLYLYKISTGTSEIVRYSSRENNAIYGVQRSLYGTTALSISSIGDLRIGYISEIKSRNTSTFPEYIEFGAGTVGHMYGTTIKANLDQYVYNLLDGKAFRLFSTGSSNLLISSGSANSSSIQFTTFSGVTETVNYRLSALSNGNFQMGNSAGSIIWGTDANRNFFIGNSSPVYRTVSAGSDVSAQIFIDPAKSLTSGIGYFFTPAHGFGFTQGNGTRRIYGGGIRAINLTSTAGSEAMDLGFYTQTGGAAAALRATINSTGISTIHLQGSSSTPTIAAGAGAGTTPTVSVTGTDMGGYITVTTGTTPSNNAVVATITFNVPYTVAPRCIQISPANINASELDHNHAIYVNRSATTTTTFTINSASTGISGTTTYEFYYSVIQ